MNIPWNIVLDWTVFLAAMYVAAWLLKGLHDGE